MIDSLTYVLHIPFEDQALRAADASWETARWTFWLVVATFLLVVGAVAAAVYAARTWKTAQDQLKMVREAEKQKEAANVSGWLHQDRTDGAMSVRLRNDNPAPVYDIRYKIIGKHQNDATPKHLVRDLPLGILPPAADGGVVKPHYVNVEDFQVDSKTPVLEASQFAPWNGKAEEPGVALEITFRDSNGVQWKRDWHGSLSQLN